MSFKEKLFIRLLFVFIAVIVGVCLFCIDGKGFYEEKITELITDVCVKTKEMLKEMRRALFLYKTVRKGRFKLYKK